MTRLTLPTLDDMTDAQRTVYDATVAGRRGRVPAPVMAWLHSPELAGRAQRLGEFVRYETTLDPRLSELAILIVARHWTSQYEWAAHEPEARRAGLGEDVIDAVAERQTPDFLQPDERAVFEFCTTLLRTHAVPDGQYATAVSMLGERAVVELVGVLGYYTLIAMTVNVFEIEAPESTTSRRLR